MKWVHLSVACTIFVCGYGDLVEKETFLSLAAENPNNAHFYIKKAKPTAEKSIADTDKNQPVEKNATIQIGEAQATAEKSIADTDKNQPVEKNATIQIGEAQATAEKSIADTDKNQPVEKNATIQISEAQSTAEKSIVDTDKNQPVEKNATIQIDKAQATAEKSIADTDKNQPVEKNVAAQIEETQPVEENIAQGVNEDQDSANQETNARQTVAAPCKIGPNSRVELSHREGDGVGYNKGYTTGALFLTPNWNRNFQPFLNFLGHIRNNGKWATNLGIGSRCRVGSSPWVLGGNFYYDWREVEQGFNAHQLGVGAEVLNPYVDLRINGYIPIGNTSQAQLGDFDSFSGHNVFCTNDVLAALSTFQAEVGAYLPGWFRFFDIYAAIGPYYLFERNVAGVKLGDAWGVKARLSAKLYDGLEAGFDITYDEIFNTRPQGYIAVSLPFGPTNLRSEGTRWKNRYPSQYCNDEALIQRRLTQNVERNEIIPVQKAKRRFIGIDPRTGEPLFIVFVNNTSSSNGTFESPYPTTALAQANSKPNDVIYIFPGDGTTTGYDTTVTLQAGQFLQSSTKNFDFLGIRIPAQTKGSNPMLTSGAGDAIVLANNTVVNGFTITGAATDGIDASSATNFAVLNNNIRNNTDNGLDFAGTPAGLKVIFNNFFFSDNAGGAPGNSEITGALPANSTLAVINNTIDADNQATFGLRITNIDENSGVLARNNHICNYLGGGGFTSGAATITSTPVGVNPARISLTGNSLTGLTNGEYLIIASSGENIVQINKNGHAGGVFFHTIVINSGGSRMQLQTNNNLYQNVAIGAFAQGVNNLAGAGQLCHEMKGNIAESTLGYLFINGTGTPGLYQILSSDGLPSGLQADNTGAFSFAGGTSAFNFVPPGTPCP